MSRVSKFPDCVYVSACAALVAVLLVLIPARARAAMNISIGNPGLDHFDSDGGVKLEFGRTDSGGQPIGEAVES